MTGSGLTWDFELELLVAYVLMIGFDALILIAADMRCIVAIALIVLSKMICCYSTLASMNLKHNFPTAITEIMPLRIRRR